MKLKTKIRAGVPGGTGNHNQTQVQPAPAPRPEADLKIKTRIKAGGLNTVNHNQTQM